MFLLKFFGSKKLIAVIAGILGAVLSPLLNSKLGLGMEPIEVAGSIGAIATMVLAYVVAQFKLDVETDGATTASSLIKYVADAQAPGPVPSNVKLVLTLLAQFVPAGPGKDAVAAALADLDKPPQA
jgi:hypothetical protein